MICLEASYIHYCCDYERDHAWVESNRLIGRVEDMTYLEVACTDPQMFLEGGIPLLVESYTHWTEGDDNRSSHGAVVDYSCLTSGVEDSLL